MADPIDSSIVYDLVPVECKENCMVWLKLDPADVANVSTNLVSMADGTPNIVKYNDVMCLILMEIKKLREEVDQLRQSLV